MAYKHSVSFRSLAGIEPGVSTLGEVRKQFGEPDKISRTKGIPSHLIDGYPGGDLVWEYESRGVTIFINRDDVEMKDPPIEEVRVGSPFDVVLPCGLHIGQSMESARSIIANHFQITNEYEDAINFKPGIDDPLLACVENWDTEKVVNIELWIDDGR